MRTGANLNLRKSWRTSGNCCVRALRPSIKRGQLDPAPGAKRFLRQPARRMLLNQSIPFLGGKPAPPSCRCFCFHASGVSRHCGQANGVLETTLAFDMRPFALGPVDWPTILPRIRPNTYIDPTASASGARAGRTADKGSSHNRAGGTPDMFPGVSVWNCDKKQETQRDYFVTISSPDR